MSNEMEDEMEDEIRDLRAMLGAARHQYFSMRDQRDDLLAALEDIVMDLQFSEVEQHKNLVKVARAAIARATGK